MRDYYQVLGVTAAASIDEIRAAFRKLAMQYHPDRNSSPTAQSTFIEITEAYEILRDPHRRQVYESMFMDNKVENDVEANTGSSSEGSYRETYYSWTEQAHARAKSYASMPYNRFVLNVLDALGRAAPHVTHYARVGFIAYVFVLSGGLLAVCGFVGLTEGSAEFFEFALLVGGALVVVKGLERIRAERESFKRDKKERRSR